MIWKLLPFGIALLLVAGILLTDALGAGLLHLLCQEVWPDNRKQVVSPRWEAPKIAGLIIYRGVPLRRAA
jgi:hypothetical protein